jgi:bifunctional non-homologous end joining protein LigD
MSQAQATAAEPRSTSLYFRQGGSDKEYHARLEAAEDGSGYVVTFQYGRRGAALTTGTKTSTPVTYEKAVAIFDKLVASKQAKGYSPGEDGTPYQSDAGRQASGLLPQLLNTIDDAQVREAISDPGWVMQEKLDGRRLMLRKTGTVVEGINKLGLVINLPTTLVKAAAELVGDLVLDGELLGEQLVAFDLLQSGGDDLRHRPYRDRYDALAALPLNGPHISYVASWTEAADKAERLAAFKAAAAEGVVFKKLSAPYTAGRPNSGGPQLKHKFVATLSAVVTTVNQQRSVGVSLLAEQGWQPVGNVTIPVNFDVPSLGQVVEVRYLYAVEGGSLYQPVYLGPRCDVEPPECVIAQLKFKAT